MWKFQKWVCWQVTLPLGKKEKKEKKDKKAKDFSLDLVAMAMRDYFGCLQWFCQRLQEKKQEAKKEDGDTNKSKKAKKDKKDEKDKKEKKDKKAPSQ